MKNQYKISLCKQNLCVNVYGDLAKAITTIIGFTILVYGVAQIYKALK
ncbi:MAG: hypothetical protein RLZZ306_918 [Bacteroidota bacterium]|jgi:hypothetical protein